MRSLCINLLPGLRRLALLDDGRLADWFLDDRPELPGAGDLYLARVNQVAAGIGAAFVDLDGEHQGFLNRADLPAELAPTREAGIESVLKPDRRLMVRVKKPAHAGKAASVSALVQLPGFALVYLPMETGIFFSRDFQGDRETIESALQEIHTEPQGWVVRSHAGKMSAEQLRAEAGRLCASYAALCKDAASGPVRRLYRDDPVWRFIRDNAKFGLRAIHTDDEIFAQNLRQELAERAPLLNGLVRLHEGTPLMFDLLKVNSELAALRKSKVWLQSGGWIHFHTTEAMVVIDVNSGKDTRRQGRNSPAMRANLEAAAEIPRQLRLRDVAGLIAVDFINVKDSGWEKKVSRSLKKALREDDAAWDMLPVNRFGVAQITREQRAVPLSERLQRMCPTCRGAGLADRPETIWIDLCEALLRQTSGIDEESVTIEAGAALFGFLDAHPTLLEAAGTKIGMRVDVGFAADLHAMHYRIAL